MKHPGQNTLIWPYALTAGIALALACAMWWSLKTQAQLIGQLDEESGKLCTLHADFSAEYFKLRHQLDRVILTQGNELEMAQLEQGLTLFGMLNQQLRDLDRNQTINRASFAAIDSFLGSTRAMLRQTPEKPSPGAFRIALDAMRELQHPVSQIAQQIAEQSQHRAAMQKALQRKASAGQHFLFGLAILLAIAAFLLWARQLKNSRQQSAELAHSQAQQQHLADDLSAFNQEKQLLLQAVSSTALPALQAMLHTLDAGESVRKQLVQLNDELADLLEIAALDSGSAQLQSESFDLHSLLTLLTSELLPACREKNLLLSLEITTDVPIMLKSNPVRIRQILHILIDNAIRHTTKGRIRVNAYAAARKTRHPRLRIDVSDTGCGIMPDRLPLIFRTTGSTPGSKNARHARILARHLGGELSVASRFGEGTTFTLDLPFTPD